MQELWPEPSAEVDIGARLDGDTRTKPGGRPWVTLVMITTVNGAIAVDGASGGLGNTDDQQRFIAARHQAGAIVVGAATARAEDYRPTVTPIGVVSGSLSLDPSARLFSDPNAKPLLFTTDQAARTRGADFDGIAEVISLGDSIEPAQVLADLDNRGISSVMLEGGPTLNGHFLRADLVDEILISYAPLIVGGEPAGLAAGLGDVEPMRFAVDRVLLGGDIVFVRYLRRR